MTSEAQPTDVFCPSGDPPVDEEIEGNKQQQRALQADLLVDLMRRYQQADAHAADQLVLTASPILARYLHSLVDTPRQVEDLLQECWLRIHRARASYRPGEPVLPWMLSVARHTRVDYFRKWKRSSGRESSIDAMTHHPAKDPQPEIQRHLEAGEILRMVRQLPHSQREVILMMKVADMSVEEVARATGSTRSAVKQKAYRAYQTLRKMLAQTHAGAGASPSNPND
jgi:RNA polymerase sigma-70 factor, ECF subfamily